MLKRLRSLITASVMIGLSLGVAFVAAEIGLRYAELDSPWRLRNFTVELVNQQETNIAIEYDPVLGYVPRPGFRDGINSHGFEGVRLNRTLMAEEELPPIEAGGILAIGDSFTYGSEVKDAESWPAQLADILDVPVVNG